MVPSTSQQDYRTAINMSFFAKQSLIYMLTFVDMEAVREISGQSVLIKISSIVIHV